MSTCEFHLIWLTIKDASRQQDVDVTAVNRSPGFREDMDKTSAADPRGSDNDGYSVKSKEDKDSQAPEAVDPLEGMPQADKYGLKGLRTLMNNYPDYHATVVGIDPNTLGLGDLNSPE